MLVWADYHLIYDIIIHGHHILTRVTFLAFNCLKFFTLKRILSIHLFLEPRSPEIFYDVFRVPQSPLHLRNAEALSHQTSQSSYTKNMVKDQLSKKRWIAVWTLASRARRSSGLSRNTPLEFLQLTSQDILRKQTNLRTSHLFCFVHLYVVECCCWLCSVLFFTSRRGYWVEINK